jgi:broad specificity phosphatase PhoE
MAEGEFRKRAAAAVARLASTYPDAGLPSHAATVLVAAHGAALVSLLLRLSTLALWLRLSRDFPATLVPTPLLWDPRVPALSEVARRARLAHLVRLRQRCDVILLTMAD